MSSSTRVRKRGGGRKLTDGRFTRAKLRHRIREFFQYEFRVNGFLSKYSLSRQTYYRFLKNNPALKEEVSAQIDRNYRSHKESIHNVLKYLRENPKASAIDYYLSRINLTINLDNQKIDLKNVHREI